MRQEKAKRRTARKTIIWTFGTVLGLAVLLILFNQKDMPGERITVMKDQFHIPDVTSLHKPYSTSPPTSGPHVQNIAQWGVHDEPLPFELLVHNLEDGGVVIYYNDKANEDTVEKLKNIVNKYSDHVLLNSHSELNDPITLTAWGRMDKMNTVDENRITEFIEAYKGIDHHK